MRQLFPKLSLCSILLTSPIASDAMTDTIDAAELFDVDVDHLARLLALIAAHWFSRVQVAYPVQSQPAQDATDGSRRHADFGCDLLASVALVAQRPDSCACGRRCLARQ